MVSAIESIVGSQHVYNVPYTPIGPRGISGLYDINIPESMLSHPPLTVIKAGSTAEISKILKLANEEKQSIQVRQGAGPVHFDIPNPFHPGSLVLDLRRMRSIKLFEENSYVEIDPFITQVDLNNYLMELGFWYPPAVPEMTWGGLTSVNISSNSFDGDGGKLTDRFILGLQVVLPTGEIVETGTRSMRKLCGPDMTRFFIGNQGLFGVVTKIRMRVIPNPVEKHWGLAMFSSLYDLFMAIAVINRKTPSYPWVMEFMDEKFLELSGMGKSLPQGILLLTSVKGDAPGEVEWKLGRMLEICSEAGATEIRSLEKEPIELEVPDYYHKVFAKKNIRELSGGALMYAMRMANTEMLKENGLLEIVGECIEPPLSKLQDTIKEIEKCKDHFISQYPDLEFTIYGHGGGPTIHPGPICPINWDYEKIVKVVHEVRNYLLKVRLKYNMGCGEQGIFPNHTEWYKATHGEVAYNLLKDIKKTFDPNGILNPGRI